MASEEARGDSALQNNRMDLESPRSSYHEDDLLTVADAARLARRSVRTLRRAYLSNKLIAHRDGNGRGVSIRYGDLRAWLTAQTIAPVLPPTPVGSIARADVRRTFDAHVQTGNRELLTAALRLHRGRPRADVPRQPGRAAAARTEGAHRNVRDSTALQRDPTPPVAPTDIRTTARAPTH